MLNESQEELMKKLNNTQGSTGFGGAFGKKKD